MRLETINIRIHENWVRYVQMNIGMSFISWGLLKGAMGVIMALPRNSVRRLHNGPIFMEIGPGAGEIFTSQTAESPFIEEN